MRITSVIVTGMFAGAVAAGPLAAQAATLRVEPNLSLAWWQVNPHLNHLWATTCPGDPSWRAGEGRSMAWAGEFLRQRSKTGYAAIRDTIIPLYPRRRARALCSEAVRGDITVADTTTWSGVQGTVAIRGDQLITGLSMRDEYAKKAILQTAAYPEIQFQIDSLAGLQQRADTLRGRIYGKLKMLAAAPQPTTAPVKAWREAGGLRVQAQFMIPAEHMTEIYGISKQALGLGVGTNIWDELHLGIDAVLKPAGM